MEIQQYSGHPNDAKDTNFRKFKKWLKEQFNKRTKQADIVADAIALQKIAEAKKAFHEAELMELAVKEKRLEIQEKQLYIGDKISEAENDKLMELNMAKVDYEEFLKDLMNKLENAKSMGFVIEIENLDEVKNKINATKNKS